MTQFVTILFALLLSVSVSACTQQQAATETSEAEIAPAEKPIEELTVDEEGTQPQEGSEVATEPTDEVLEEAQEIN